MLRNLSPILRSLARARGFTAVTVLTIALAIGANTGMFGVLNDVLLRKPPFRDPSSLVILSEKAQQFPVLSVSYPNFKDWQAQLHTVTDVSAVRTMTATMTGSGEPERIVGQMLSTNALSLLGVQPILGRGLTGDDDRGTSGDVALISKGLWQRRFDGSPSAIGRTLSLDKKQYVIVGVLPGDFELLQQRPEVVLPFGPWARSLPDDRSWHPGIVALARLAPGATLEQARAEMSTVAKRLYAQYPDTNIALDANVNIMQEQLVANAKPALLMLAGAVGFVLLVACANVANLMLARAVTKQRDVAVRIAIGASRSQIFRQFMLETLVLSLGGGILGLMLSALALAAVGQMHGTGLPPNTRLHVDARVAAFSLLAALITALICAAAPAIAMFRFNLRSTLSESAKGSASRGTMRLRSLLVVSEVALSIVLVIAAGAMIRSLQRLSQVSPGFASDHILAADIPVSPTTYASPEARMTFFDSVLSRMETLPGVQSAASTSMLPVSGNGAVIHFNIQGRPPKSPAEFVMANYRVVSPAYFKTIGQPLMSGRYFSPADRDGAPAVVIVNETMAHTYFPGEDPIGKRFQIGSAPDKSVPWMEVVGVVGDVHQALSTDPAAEMYLPVRQGNELLPVLSLTMVLRTFSEPQSLSAAVRTAVHQVDASQPVINIRTMEEAISTSVAEPRFRTTLLTAFAAIALVIAAIGIYGVMSYSIAQMTREIGIRLALGSTQNGVRKLVLLRGLRLTGIGVIIGVAASLISARYLGSMLYHVHASDPAIVALVAALFAAVSLLASYVPALRATRVPVTEVLRQE